jgi:hypothetical protein
MDGTELALGFTPYTSLNYRTLTAYGIRSDHYLAAVGLAPDVKFSVWYSSALFHFLSLVGTASSSNLPVCLRV